MFAVSMNAQNTALTTSWVMVNEWTYHKGVIVKNHSTGPSKAVFVFVHSYLQVRPLLAPLAGVLGQLPTQSARQWLGVNK